MNSAYHEIGGERRRHRQRGILGEEGGKGFRLQVQRQHHRQIEIMDVQRHARPIDSGLAVEEEHPRHHQP
jgi:hypothetical protein